MPLFHTYRSALQADGFTPTENHAHRFFKKSSDHTALVVNLRDIGDETNEAVYIVYGVTTIVASADMEVYFRAEGSSDEEIKLRHDAVATADNESKVAETIRTAFAAYAPLDATAVRATAKEKQKVFLNRIHAVLKPMGYRRKGNTWTKALPNGWHLEFNAQKSAYSDQFYFNYCHYHYRAGDKKYLAPSGNRRLPRIDGEGRTVDIFDWQLMSDAAIDALIVRAAVGVLSALEERLTRA